MRRLHSHCPSIPWREKVDDTKSACQCLTNSVSVRYESACRECSRIRRAIQQKNISARTGSRGSRTRPSSREAQVMLWLISSEFTNPSLDDILAFTKERTFDAACTVLEKQLSAMGKVHEVYEKIEKPLIPVIREDGSARHSYRYARC